MLYYSTPFIRRQPRGDYSEIDWLYHDLDKGKHHSANAVCSVTVETAIMPAAVFQKKKKRRRGMASGANRDIFSNAESSQVGIKTIRLLLNSVHFPFNF